MSRGKEKGKERREGEEVKNYRSEGGLRARNGLCDSCACGCVAGVVHLLGSAGRVGFVVLLSCRWPAGFAPGGRVCRGTSGEGGRGGNCSPERDLRYGVSQTSPNVPHPENSASFQMKEASRGLADHGVKILQ